MRPRCSPRSICMWSVPSSSSPSGCTKNWRRASRRAGHEKRKGECRDKTSHTNLLGVRLSAQFTWKISAWTARRFWEIARRSLCISRDQRGPVTSSRTISTSSFYTVAMLDGELRWFSQGRYLARMTA